MSDLSVTKTFISGEAVEAADFNTNYSDIVTYINNRNSGTATWDAMYGTSSTNVPLTANNSTGTQSIVQLKDNGTTVFEVFDGGFVTAPLQAFGRSTKSAAQALTTNTTLITFDTTSQNGSYVDASGKFTCPATGIYLIACSLSFDTKAGGPAVLTPYAAIYKNGAEWARHSGTSTVGSQSPGISSLAINDILSLTMNDTIEIYLVATDGLSGSPQVYAGANTWFLVHKLS